MGFLEEEFIAGHKYYKAFAATGVGSLTSGPGNPYVKQAKKLLAPAKAWFKGDTLAEFVGNTISGKLIAKTTSPVKPYVNKGRNAARSHRGKDSNRTNGLGGHSWITKPGRYTMVIVFHDANRAGAHIDVHIDRLSVVYRVKPQTYSQLRFHPDGRLTQNSKDLLIDHVKSEINNGSRVPQNLDHSLSNAKCEWLNGGTDGTSYGAGPTRQVIAETEVDVFKAVENGPIEFFAPLLNPRQSMYLYRLYHGDDRRAPILIWGNHITHPPTFKERLHLKLVQPESFDAVFAKLDTSSCTAKYDGSSCYVHITSKGTHIYSPRTSKRHGTQIEYTHKLDGIANITSFETIIGMGELLFYRKDSFCRKSYIPQSEGSGILNGYTLLPKDVYPEIRLYRIDKVGRTDTSNMEFWENRQLQQSVALTSPKHFKVVETMTPSQALRRGYEGVVVVPTGASVNEGVKVKWWQNDDDWRIDSVDFVQGGKGAIAGVVTCTSLESNKVFRLGPGQVGNRDLCEDMMTHPNNYEGCVIKVHSRQGHEGRAAKMTGFHDDKGVVST